MRVQLWSFDGNVAHELILPENIVEPTVIIWGDKVFIRNFFGAYHQSFAYFVPTAG
jgi:hypothetical protein